MSAHPCSYNGFHSFRNAFLKVLGVCLWDFLTTSWSAFVRSDADIGPWSWLKDSALILPKDVLSGWGQGSVQAGQVHPQQTRSSLLCCNRKRPAPNRFKSFFHRTKGPSPTPEKRTPTIIPFPANFMLYAVFLATAKPTGYPDEEVRFVNLENMSLLL